MPPNYRKASGLSTQMAYIMHTLVQQEYQSLTLPASDSHNLVNANSGLKESGSRWVFSEVWFFVSELMGPKRWSCGHQNRRSN